MTDEKEASSNVEEITREQVQAAECREPAEGVQTGCCSFKKLRAVWL